MKRQAGWFLVLFMGVGMLFACASAPEVSETVRPGHTLQTGVASWYGPGFHGQTTANGETYDQNELTAAHRTLPFNTVVRVEHRSNGKSVRVRINDRGPYVGDRIIDLSRRAAEQLDLIGSGVAPVRLILLKPGGEIYTDGEDLNREIYTVQVGSFSRPSGARSIAEKLGQGAHVQQAEVQGETFYRVYFGNYLRRDRAERTRQRLAREGYEGFVKQVQN